MITLGVVLGVAGHFAPKLDADKFSTYVRHKT